MIWNIILFIIPVIFLSLILWYEKKEHKDNAIANNSIEVISFFIFHSPLELYNL
jgi:hypothetical protein